MTDLAGADAGVHGRPTAARGPYAKTARVRKHIIEAATKSFAHGGFYGTSLNDIAERAGISRRGLGHHFASKEELLEAVLELHQDQDAVAVRGASGVEALAAVFENWRPSQVQPSFVQLYTVLRADATAEEHPAFAHHRQQYEQLRLFLTRAFDTARARGEVDSDHDSETLAATFLALMDGLHLQWLYDRSAVNAEDIVAGYLHSVVPTFPAVRSARLAASARVGAFVA